MVSCCACRRHKGLPLKSFAQLQQETSTVQLEFLMADIATANTFLDVAGTTRDAATRARNLEHANVAYATVDRLRDRVKVSSEQAAELQRRLDLLRERIYSMKSASESLASGRHL